jgi:hypothetical protein
MGPRIALSHLDDPLAPVERSCTGKHAYPDAQAAHAGAVRRNMLEQRPVVRAYACARCGAFHVGGIPARDLPSGAAASRLADFYSQAAPEAHRYPPRRNRGRLRLGPSRDARLAEAIAGLFPEPVRPRREARQRRSRASTVR